MGSAVGSIWVSVDPGEVQSSTVGAGVEVCRMSEATSRGASFVVSEAACLLSATEAARASRLSRRFRSLSPTAGFPY